jgi:hypothetical protein
MSTQEHSIFSGVDFHHLHFGLQQVRLDHLKRLVLSIGDAVSTKWSAAAWSKAVLPLLRRIGPTLESLAICRDNTPSYFDVAIEDVTVNPILILEFPRLKDLHLEWLSK